MVDEHAWRLTACSSSKWASSLRNHLAMEHLLSPILLTFAITFTHGYLQLCSWNNHISKVVYVLLQLFCDYNLMYLHVMLFPMLNVLYLYISTYRSIVLSTLRLFSAVWLRAIRDVAHVSGSKSDNALYCHLLPYAHISSTKVPSRNDKETGQIVPWLPCRPAGDLASLELGQDFHSGRDITRNTHHYRSTFVSFIFEKEKQIFLILAPLNNAITFHAWRRIKRKENPFGD